MTVEHLWKACADLGKAFNEGCDVVGSAPELDAPEDRVHSSSSYVLAAERDALCTNHVRNASRVRGATALVALCTLTAHDQRDREPSAHPSLSAVRLFQRLRCRKIEPDADDRYRPWGRRG